MLHETKNCRNSRLQNTPWFPQIHRFWRHSVPKILGWSLLSTHYQRYRHPTCQRCTRSPSHKQKNLVQSDFPLQPVKSLFLAGYIQVVLFFFHFFWVKSSCFLVESPFFHIFPVKSSVFLLRSDLRGPGVGHQGFPGVAELREAGGLETNRMDSDITSMGIYIYTYGAVPDQIRCEAPGPPRRWGAR